MKLVQTTGVSRCPFSSHSQELTDLDGSSIDSLGNEISWDEITILYRYRHNPTTIPAPARKPRPPPMTNVSEATPKDRLDSPSKPTRVQLQPGERSSQRANFLLAYCFSCALTSCFCSTTFYLGRETGSPASSQCVSNRLAGSSSLPTTSACTYRARSSVPHSGRATTYADRLGWHLP